MKKRTLIIIATTITVLILLVFFFFFFTIKNSKGCNQLVIDTYELASGIDIPKQTNSQCYYNEDEQIRVSIYSISDIENFINANGFTELEYDENRILWSTEFLLEKNAIVPTSTNSLYLVTGKKKGNLWQCILDGNTGKMWFEIKWN
jgi:hypothetical protein